VHAKSRSIIPALAYVHAGGRLTSAVLRGSTLPESQCRGTRGHLQLGCKLIRAIARLGQPDSEPEGRGQSPCKSRVHGMRHVFSPKLSMIQCLEEHVPWPSAGIRGGGAAFESRAGWARIHGVPQTCKRVTDPGRGRAPAAPPGPAPPPLQAGCRCPPQPPNPQRQTPVTPPPRAGNRFQWQPAAPATCHCRTDSDVTVTSKSLRARCQSFGGPGPGTPAGGARTHR
jgi:hypothetical protein